MRKIIILLFVFIIPMVGVSQKNVEFLKSNFKNDKKGLKEAVLNFQDGDSYYEESENAAKVALEYYLKANAFNPNNALLNYKIGLCYLKVFPASKAITYIEKAKKLDPEVDSKIDYSYGHALHLDLQFDKAIKVYTRFKRNMTPKEKKDMLTTVNRNIAECYTGIEMLKNPVRVTIDNLGEAINTEYPDYGAVVNIDESMLFFSSRRANSTGGKINPEDDMYFEDAYLSIKEGDEWLPAENMSKPINTKYHDAVVGVAPDGNTLILYRDENGGDLFHSERKGDKWTTPKAFEAPINSKYQETSASFSYNGKRLYFVSDRPGGYGKKDIYYCDIREDGTYRAARNLGKNVNTAFDEVGVFAHADGKTVYFSSMGHQGMGSYDVYKTVFEVNKWSAPENLGYPINTPSPEVYFSVGASGKNAYYSSNLEGGFGDQDIYKITFLGPEVLTEEQRLALADSVGNNTAAAGAGVLIAGTSQLTLLKGTVVDELTLEPIEADIELVINDTSNVVATFKSNSVTGKYLVSLPSGDNYGLAISAHGYLFYSDNFNIPEFEEYNEVTRNIKLQRIEIGSHVILNNVFFEYKKYDVSEESKTEINRIIALMKKYETIKIEIDGHTDNIASAKYNIALSKKRAQSVVDYIVSNGIDKSRIVAKGYGFAKPIATNDTAEGRKLNRRSEIIITDK
ncbi:MAG: hypothetical protein B6I18_05155 [Bacteroidetes bacterium 4572_112]|nr:MAG: hypothetical protein B6I18_05155 [Bacteroidetes bacterium 4572_112]